jgi:hypothetical protein
VSRSNAQQVAGHDSQIWERLSWRKSLKLPIYARWPCVFALLFAAEVNGDDAVVAERMVKRDRGEVCALDTKSWQERRERWRKLGSPPVVDWP